MTAPRAAEPALFARSVASLRSAAVRPDVTVHEVPAPVRVAPFAFALGAEVTHGDDEVGAGRLVLLHDPDGQPAWDGASRVVAYARGKVDADMARDPLLPAVVWSWLVDAFDTHGAAHHAAAGTVTATTSARFGTISAAADLHEVELRCSWTPDEPDLTGHLSAWCDLLATMSGLPPGAPGVVPLAPRRARA